MVEQLDLQDLQVHKLLFLSQCLGIIQQIHNPYPQEQILLSILML